jgi:transcriptional antiterminator Rof (Rho-off)
MISPAKPKWFATAGNPQTHIHPPLIEDSILFSVYVLQRLKTGRIYTGYTSDLSHGIERHRREISRVSSIFEVLLRIKSIKVFSDPQISQIDADSPVQFSKTLFPK